MQPEVATVRYRYFYRVEDHDSCAVTSRSEGIWAAGTCALRMDARRGRDWAKLGHAVKHHLDWNSRCASPFLSTYSDRDVAFDIARGRKRMGNINVTITVIDVERVRGQVEFRKVRPLAERLGISISDRAWHNSWHEWIFLHHIPPAAVIAKIRV